MAKAMPKHIAVIGAAIAGLSAALAAAKAGHHVTIFGKAPRHLGGALQLAPNGFAALARLGIEGTIAPHMTRLSAIELRSARTNGCLSIIDHEAPVRRDYASVGRAQLVSALLDAAEAHKHIQFDERLIEGIKAGNRSASLQIKDEILSFDVIIGADGKDGLARQLISPQAKEAATRCALRTAVPAATLPRTFSAKRCQLWLGDGFHLVSYPFADGAEVNLVLCTKDSAEENHEMIAAHVKDNPVLACLADDEITWHRTPLPEASQLATWRKGHVILVGDAAHFMPPHLAQGAGQTLEDAASLYEALVQHDDMTLALKDWSVRRARTLAPIIERAQSTGALMRLSGPFSRLRNAAIELGGQRLIESWLKNIWHA